MPGIFEIVENMSNDVKFRGLVSFNGKLPEFHEVDISLPSEMVKHLQKEKQNLENQTGDNSEKIIELDQQISGWTAWLGTPAAFINSQLQATADADFERSLVVPVELEIEGGKLVE